jgi:hypothetical protein
MSASLPKRLMTSSDSVGWEPQALPGVPAWRKAATFLLFPLPSHLPKRNSVRQVDAALQTGALSIIALYLRTIAGAPLRKHRKR